MRYYIYAIVGAIVIVLVVAFLWWNWGIDLTDFTTGLAIGLILLIPFIVWWSINKEREQGQKHRKRVVTNSKSLQESKIMDKIREQQREEQIQRNNEEIENLERGESSDPQRRRENEDRFTPTGIK
jgi:TolA-binding protein